MTLSSLCTSLPLSKRLKELGVEIPSTFIHLKAKGGTGIYYLTDHLRNSIGDSETYPAFTSSELMELLPGEIKEGIYHHYLSVHKYKDIYSVQYEQYYYSEPINSLGIQENNTHLADALALLLIHLIENEIWKPTN